MNFKDAVNAQNSGDLKKAEEIYKNILSQNPNNFEALFNYAVLSFNLKNYIKSEDLFKKAILLNSNNHQIYNGYGVLLKELNKDEKAVTNFYRSLEIKEDYLNPYLNLLQIYKKYNNQEEMLKIIDKIISIKPDFPIMYHEKASILSDLEKFDEAINTIETVFKYEEHSIENYFRLYKLCEKKRPDRCEEISDKIINILKEKILVFKIENSPKKMADKKEHADIALVNTFSNVINRKVSILKETQINKISELYYNLGIIYMKIKKLDLAEENLNLAISFDSSNVFYFIKLAETYQLMKKYTAAKKNYEKAIEIEPLNIAANINYAILIKDEFGELENAKKIIIKFDKLFLNNSSITPIKAWILLNEGNYKDGWKAHNAHILKQKNHMKLPQFQLWNKEKLDGNLLIWSGQGIGDFIFFAKIVKLTGAYAKKVLFICDRRLVPIYKRFFEKIDPKKFIIEEKYDKVRFSKHIASEMLGEFFANSVQEINQFSNMKIVPSREWDLEIDNFLSNLPKNKLNVGLSWSTLNTMESNEKNVPLDKFSKIFKKENINFINIQFGDVKEEISSFKEKNKVEFYEYKKLNITKEIDKLLSLINKLDLVITIQNSTAHISLSAGKKTFVLLSYKPPRFYWHGPSPEKSYWYPEAKLYRQKNANHDWTEILDKLSKDLDLTKIN
jgi:tetratricopeptide (TPR) repeat protein